MNALISVSDKTGIVEFAKALSQMGINLISTGGTAKLLSEQGLVVREVADLTGFPEMLDGRVKTLHPKVHGGLLARRDLDSHMQATQAHHIELIDLLVVNLYPFEQTVSKPNCTFEDAIENIDIGGPAMVRSAAKNWQDVAVLTDASQYDLVIRELREHKAVTKKTKLALSVAAFNRISNYDASISNYLSARSESGELTQFPQQFNTNFTKIQDLRYGENPHQSAALYKDMHPAVGSLVSAQQLQGKELSYNNLADADAAWECVKSFKQTACVIVKHANPCGVATGASTLEAYTRAFSTDPTSAFGGIIAFNHSVDAPTASALSEKFVEVLIATDYSQEALAILAKKPNVRVLKIALPSNHSSSANPATSSFALGTVGLDIKRVGGGILVQSSDAHELELSDLKIVTKVKPTPSELEDMLFAWKVAKFVKSNAIVFCRNSMTLGVGAGQMSRLDSARIASIKAEHAGLTLSGSVVASDAFFPFRDGLDVVVKAGATCVIQPGGSMRDQEVIDAANEQGVAMALTGVRHFRH
jgi:phosphoribosylaminoimidazolecarboxamide formyltransferase/IMP cyclohydrolase